MSKVKYVKVADVTVNSGQVSVFNRSSLWVKELKKLPADAYYEVEVFLPITMKLEFEYTGAETEVPLKKGKYVVADPCYLDEILKNNIPGLKDQLFNFETYSDGYATISLSKQD